MNRITKTILVLFVIFSTVHIALADRGVGRKSRGRVILNINTTGSLRNSIAFNLKTGLAYKGSLLASREVVGNTITCNSIVTFQKGNTIYIVPFKHKMAMPEMR